MEKNSLLILRQSLVSAVSLVVFLFLDFLLCFVYRFLDRVLEESPRQCYCRSGCAERDISGTLHGRRSVFRRIGRWLTVDAGTDEAKRSVGSSRAHRWSDCGCEGCTAWQRSGPETLHVVVKEPAQETSQDCRSSPENIVLLHGFLSSSSIWIETVLPNLSEPANSKLRIFAVDLLGFGKSPKPATSSYTLHEHIEKIEESVLQQFQLNSFHLVAHSMGCIIAVALAAKHPSMVKTITLIAPPYFPSIEENASHTILNKLARRSIWPPLLFGSSVMSWYEHLGRCVCFFVCRHHSIWERLLKLITRRRDLHFSIVDLTKHSHNSAWHTMHNVVCEGAEFMDKYLEVLDREGVPVKLIHGDKDQVVPLGCSYDIKLRIPHAELHVIENGSHASIILGREKAFTGELEDFWFLTARNHT